jgi:hypothetical protein
VEAISHLFSTLRARPEPDQERADREARQSQVIEEFARAVVARKLEAPATLFLELNRPLGFLYSQAALFARPFVSFFLPALEMEGAAEVIDDPEALDRLIERIGELSAERAV